MIKNKIYVGMTNSRSIKFIGIFDRLENDNNARFRSVIYLSDNTYVYGRDMVFPYYVYGRDMVFPYYLYNISSPSLMVLSFYLKLKKKCRNIKDRCFLSRKEIIDLNAYLY